MRRTRVGEGGCHKKSNAFNEEENATTPSWRAGDTTSYFFDVNIRPSTPRPPIVGAHQLVTVEGDIEQKPRPRSPEQLPQEPPLVAHGQPEPRGARRPRVPAFPPSLAPPSTPRPATVRAYRPLHILLLILQPSNRRLHEPVPPRARERQREGHHQGQREHGAQPEQQAPRPRRILGNDDQQAQPGDVRGQVPHPLHREHEGYAGAARVLAAIARVAPTSAAAAATTAAATLKARAPTPVAHAAGSCKGGRERVHLFFYRTRSRCDLGGVGKRGWALRTPASGSTRCQGNCKPT